MVYESLEKMLEQVRALENQLESWMDLRLVLVKL